MKRMSHTHAEHERTQLAPQFDHWRRQRTTRAERIPHALWEQAVALATVLPLSRVAKRVRVSWSDLHTHWAAHHATTAVDASPAALRFVAVTAPSPWPFQPVGTEVARHRADGACLRMCAREAPLPLAALVRIFLETTAGSR